MIDKYSITQDSMPSVTQIPIGVIIPYCGNTIPNGWLLCDGGTFDSTQYPVLADILGSTYGAQVGTTITLPSFNSKAPMGSGTGVLNDGTGSLTARTLGSSVGSSTVTLTSEQTGNQSHTHSSTLVASGSTSHSHLAGGSSTTTSTNSGSIQKTASAGSTVTSSSNSMMITLTATNPTYSITSVSAHNNIQAAIIVKFIIKAI